MITVCEMPGAVSSAGNAAAAATKELTPGTTVYSMPRASRARICSPIAPYRLGSPVCRRTTALPAACAPLITSTCSPSAIPALSCSSQPGRVQLSTALGTSDPA